MTKVIGRINFKPKPHQLRIMTDPKRHRGVNLHRRAGKTVMAIFAGLETQLSCPLPYPKVAYIAPFLKQAKRISWKYLEQITMSAGKQHFDINRSELTTTCRHNNGTFSLLGADNLDAIRGEYFDMVIVDEIAQCDPRLWDSVIRPALADRKGRALLMGTPKGRMNKLYELSKVAPDDPEWSYHQYDCTQTGMLPESEIDAARRDMPGPLFEQEFMCSFTAALIGSVYGREVNELQAKGRFTKVKHDAQLPVHMAFDLGFRDATAIWFVQFVGSEIHVIGYCEFTLMSLPDICGELRKLEATNGWTYASQHYGPHDLWQRELGSGNSRADIMQRHGFEFHPAVNWPIEDGIEAVRALIPHLWIDQENAERALEILINYQFEFDDKRITYKTRPLHNWASHGADAIRMLAVALDKSVQREGVPKSRRRNDEGLQGWLI